MVNATNSNPSYPPKTKENEAARAPERDYAAPKSAVDRVAISRETRLKLVQEALVGEVGKKVAKALDGAGIELTAYADQDFSAQATAQRIFDFTTGFYSAYREKHKGQSEDEINAGFEKLVRGSVQKGFEQAMGILAAAGFSSEETKVAHETLSLLNAKFDDYFASLKHGSETAKA